MIGIFNPKKDKQADDTTEQQVEATETQATDTAEQPEVIKPHGSGHCCGGCGGE